jgi:alkylation response protein AidB-like acyl-CoA dehydrogenase
MYRRLVALARANGRSGELHCRQELVRLHTLLELNRLNVLRSRSGTKPTGAEANIAKLLMSEISRLAGEIAGLVGGLDAVLVGDDAPEAGLLSDIIQYSPAPSVYGGTDQIQKNIIGERILGLPR